MLVARPTHRIRTYVPNQFTKYLLAVCALALCQCAVMRDIRDHEVTRPMKISPADGSFPFHVITGNYVLSVRDSAARVIRGMFSKGKDSLVFRQDTIDLSTMDPYWVQHPVKRELRKCMEADEIGIYSRVTSSNITKIKRTVSASDFNGTHSFYLYRHKGDTVLYSISFDLGTPPF